jgi:predicted nucleotide-binding protein
LGKAALIILDLRCSTGNGAFESGYFVGTQRRSHVAALVSPGVEKPSDIAGLVYIEYGVGTDWKEHFRREMRAAGIKLV